MINTMITIIATVLSTLVPAAVNADSILEQITAANNAFANSIIAGDVDYLVNDYTGDACIIAPKAPLTCGTESIRPFWSSVIESKPKSVEIITQTAQSDGSLAYATGELIITDAESAVHKNRFVLVFKQVSGAWKLHVDSWTPQ